jgi:hypothetical protein
VGVSSATRLIVSGRLKTGQWWSIQNQPLIWLAKRVRVVLARRVFALGLEWWLVLRVIGESEERANNSQTQNAVTALCAEIGQSKF